MDNDDIKAARRSERVKSIFDSDDSEDEDIGELPIIKEGQITTTDLPINDVFSNDSTEDLSDKDICEGNVVSTREILSQERVSDECEEFISQTEDKESEFFKADSTDDSESQSDEADCKESTELESTIKSKSSYADGSDMNSENEDTSKHSFQESPTHARQVDENEDSLDMMRKEDHPKTGRFASDFDNKLNADLLVSSDDDDKVSAIKEISSDLNLLQDDESSQDEDSSLGMEQTPKTEKNDNEEQDTAVEPKERDERSLDLLKESDIFEPESNESSYGNEQGVAMEENEAIEKSITEESDHDMNLEESNDGVDMLLVGSELEENSDSLNDETYEEQSEPSADNQETLSEKIDDFLEGDQSQPLEYPKDDLKGQNDAEKCDTLSQDKDGLFVSTETSMGVTIPDQSITEFSDSEEISRGKESSFDSLHTEMTEEKSLINVLKASNTAKETLGGNDAPLMDSHMEVDYHSDANAESLQTQDPDKMEVPPSPVLSSEHNEPREEVRISQNSNSDSGVEDNFEKSKIPPPDTLDESPSRTEQTPVQVSDGSVTLPLNPLNISPPVLSEKKNGTKIRVEDIFTDSENEEATTSQSKGSVNLPTQQNSKDSDAKRKTRRTQKREGNISDMLEAFKKGWVRELVYRSGNAAMNRADVYYRTPSGKKLRSKIQIEDYLLTNEISDLTLRNFTFQRAPLGVSESYERIRNATANKNDGSQSVLDGASSSSKSNKRPIDSEVTIIEPISNGPPPPKKSKPVEVPKNAPNHEEAKKTIMNRLQHLDTRDPGVKKSFLTGRQVGNNSKATVQVTQLFGCSPPLMSSKIVTPLLHKELREKTFHCTPNCDAGGGSVPNLQCVKCVCLFHSECCFMPASIVGIIMSSVAKFLCPNCYREESEVSLQKRMTSFPQGNEPLSYDPPDDSEDEGLFSDVEDAPIKEVSLRPKTPPLPYFRDNHRAPIHTQRRILPPQPLLPQITQGFPNIPGAASSLPEQNITPPVYINDAQKGFPIQTSTGQYYLFQTQPGQPPILLPMALASSMNLPIPTPSIAPNSPLNTTKFISGPPPMQLPVSVSNNAVIPQNQQSVCPPTKEVKSAEPSSVLPKEIAAVRNNIHFLGDMAQVYHIMKRIFSYLSITDLMVVSRVCLMWRDLALNPCYWRIVRLRNVCVKDWDKLVEFLNRRGTIEIDLRKMVIYAALNEPSKERDENSTNEIKLIEEKKEENQEISEKESQPELKETPNEIKEADASPSEFEMAAKNETQQDSTQSLPEVQTNQNMDTEMNIENAEEMGKGKDETIGASKDDEIDSTKDEEMDISTELSAKEEQEPVPASPPIEHASNEVNRSKDETRYLTEDISEEKTEITTEEVELDSVIPVCGPSSSYFDATLQNGDMEAKSTPAAPSRKDSQSDKENNSDPIPMPQTPEEKEQYERFLYNQRIASSVLSEHDYFGRNINQSSSDSSSESSSDSSTSDSESEVSDGDSSPGHNVVLKDPVESLKDEMVAVMNMDIPKAEYEPDSYEDVSSESVPPITKKRKPTHPPSKMSKFRKLKTPERKSGDDHPSPSVIEPSSDLPINRPASTSPKGIIENHPLNQEKTKAPTPSSDNEVTANPLPSLPPTTQNEGPLTSQSSLSSKENFVSIIKMPTKPKEPEVVPSPPPLPPLPQEKLPQKTDANRAWHVISSSLKKLQTLKKLVIGTCEPDVVEIIVYHCRQLTSLTALSLMNRSSSEIASFDPSFLMHSRQLQELRLASQKTFHLLSNFNFIKLPQLKILTLKGLKTSNMGWPYLGTNLTHLYLSCINTFSSNNWKNLSSMSNLITLEMDGGGADHDTDFCTALSPLQKLKYLSLFDWHIGPKLPSSLKRMHNIRYLHIIPALENLNMRGVYAGRFVVIIEMMKQHLSQVIWGIQPLTLTMEDDIDKIYLLAMKANKDSTAAEDEPKLLSLGSLRALIEHKVPQVSLQLKKVSDAPWTWGTNGDWR